MATTTTITKILFRRGNDADRQNTILASGEPGWTLDTSRLWIGDGRTPGGIPAVSATDYHLHYVDENNETNTTLRQRMDINIPGLFETLAGDRVGYDRMFHATDRAIANDYELEFSGVNTPSDDPDIVYNGPSNKSFKIDRSLGNEGVINIADALVIDTSTNTITFGTNNSTFNIVAQQQVFAEGDITFFEDKTIDLNVPTVNGTVKQPGTPEANVATADKTGFYLSHVGYTSAGRIAVAEGADQEAWSTFWLAPPVYDQDWADGFNRLDRAESTTVNWTGWDHVPLNTVGTSQQHGSKPLAIRSARPGNQDGAGYDGYADLVFETGLIVYGAGDTDAKSDGWNGYLINQSVDTGADVKFNSIEIQGDPMNVKSGGTGRSSLTAGGVLIANETDPEGPIQSLVLNKGKLITGDSNNKARATTLNTDNWLDTTIASDGTITLRNRFAPTAVWQNQTQTETEYFHKWYRAQTESGTLTPATHDSTLTIEGDDSTSKTNRRLSPAVGNDIHTRVNNSATAMEVVHTWHANTLCDAVATATGDNTNPGAVVIDAGFDSSVSSDAQVLGMIKVNRSGHVLDVASKDLSVYIDNAIDNALTGNFFLTNADSSTSGTGVNTSWLDRNMIRFSHDGTPRTSLYDTTSNFVVIPGNEATPKNMVVVLETTSNMFRVAADNQDRVNLGVDSWFRTSATWRDGNKIHLSHNSDPDSSLYQTSSKLVLESGDVTGDGKHLDVVVGDSKQMIVKAGSSWVSDMTKSKTDFYSNNSLSLRISSNLHSKGDIVAYYSFSDERLKTNVQQIAGDEALSLVNQLQGVRFNWNDQHNTDKQIGLIAQQVESVVPEVVKENHRIDDDTMYKQVDYDKLVPLLIESVKTLTARVEQLEAELNR